MIRSKADMDDIQVVDSYNPQIYNIPESAFLDDVHLKDDEYIRRMFENKLLI